MTEPQLADIERRADIAGNVSGKQAIRLIEYLRELKEENCRLQKLVEG